MRSTFSKYKFKYGEADYPYNLRYKWMSRHNRNRSQSSHSRGQDAYFIEMLIAPSNSCPLQVQQLTPETCAKIDQAWIERKSKVFIRTQELYGHYINLEEMTLISTCNMSKRRLFTLKTLPEGAIIYHPMTQTSMKLKDMPSPIKSVTQFPLERQVEVESFSPQHKLRHLDQMLNSRLQDLGHSVAAQQEHDSRFHWMEMINHRYKPLKQSISDAIERSYQLFRQGLSNAVSEFTWQVDRFVLDLRENTLLNTKTLEVAKLRRVNLDEVRNLEMHPRTQESPNKAQANRNYEWQFEIANFHHRGIEWQSYDEKTQKKLERKYQDWQKLGSKSLKNNFSVMRGSQVFYIDYERMVELNPITKAISRVRRE